MIVVDASAILAILERAPAAVALRRRLFAGEALHAPHLIDLEIAQVLRRRVAGGEMTVFGAQRALEAWRQFPVRRWSHDRFLPRVWSLRSTMTAYDAVYIALAEALGAAVVTTDGKLACAPGHAARVEVIEP